MNLGKLILPIMLLVLFGVSACNTADGSEFVGTWQCFPFDMKITHFSGNQYLSEAIVGNTLWVYRDGLLVNQSGQPIFIDKQTGKLNVAGQLCPRK